MVHIQQCKRQKGTAIITTQNSLRFEGERMPLLSHFFQTALLRLIYIQRTSYIYVYNLMSLSTHEHVGYHHHNQDYRCIQKFQRFPCFPLLCFLLLFLMVRTLNVRSTLLTNFEVHNAILLTPVTVLYSGSLELIHLA